MPDFPQSYFIRAVYIAAKLPRIKQTSETDQ